MSKFFGRLTRREPTAIGGGLLFVCEGTGFSTGGRALLLTIFCGADQGVQHVHNLKSLRHEKVNAWICERPTTDRDLASVIPEKKKKRTVEECKSAAVAFFRA